MKEIEKIDSDKIEIVDQVQEKRVEQFVGSIHPYPGHTLFEVNGITGTIEPAKFEAMDIHFNPNGNIPNSNRKKLVINKGCIYVSALNKKNVIKHLEKGSIGGR